MLIKIFTKLISFCLIRYLFFESNIIYYISKYFKLKSSANELNFKDIISNVKKDTVFIMGSGYSINDISSIEWKNMKKRGDIFSFNHFYKGKFIPINYHIVREMGRYTSVFFNKKIFLSYTNQLFNNPFFKNTIYFVKYDHRASATIWSVFFLKLYRCRNIYFYRNNMDKKYLQKPSENMNEISHCNATLFDAINIAYLLGYKNIVLVGIELYDRRYFWLRQNKTRVIDLNRGKTYKDLHNTTNYVLRIIPEWKNIFDEKGVKLFNYNPKSLLKNILPLYEL